MIQFYSPEISEKPELGQEDSGHCVRVLRKKEGDHIFVVDGLGKRYECEIAVANPRRVQLRILEVTPVPKNWEGRIVLCVAPTKNMDRMEWLVEKGVEIGVDEFIPMICDRSERKVIKSERLSKIAVSAMKQSLKAEKPLIREAVSFKELLGEGFSGISYMGYCSDSVGRSPFVKACNPTGDIRIFIGPEGDFSPQEVELALSAGVVPVTFGRERLRTETAALAALHSVQLLKEQQSLL